MASGDQPNGFLPTALEPLDLGHEGLDHNLTNGIVSEMHGEIDDKSDYNRPESASDSQGQHPASNSTSLANLSSEERLRRMRAAEELKQKQKYAAFLESQKQAEMARQKAQEDRKRKIAELRQREEARRTLVLQRRKELEMNNKTGTQHKYFPLAESGLRGTKAIYLEEEQSPQKTPPLRRRHANMNPAIIRRGACYPLLSFKCSYDEALPSLPILTAVSYEDTIRIETSTMAATARTDKRLQERARRNLENAHSPMEKLTQACLARGAQGIRDFGRQFKIMDDDGNRRLSFEEFFKGCRDFHVELEKADIQDIFNEIDKDHSGSIDFEEFLKALRPPMNKARRDIVNKAFMKLDKTNDGVIRIDDLKGVYNVKNHPKYLNGEMTEDQILLEFLKIFQNAADADDTITREEFLNYYSGLSASIDNDAYFDLVMRQSFKL
ncbi:unnamed protein product [Calicophoron daubneyi]|uniref:EF-hand domain-containing protein n=1 Tax=Calicophoron daubneyi TaxID=300641 RepID=A0AAV2TF23_CALDB